MVGDGTTSYYRKSYHLEAELTIANASISLSIADLAFL